MFRWSLQVDVCVCVCVCVQVQDLTPIIVPELQTFVIAGHLKKNM